MNDDLAADRDSPGRAAEFLDDLAPRPGAPPIDWRVLLWSALAGLAVGLVDFLLHLRFAPETAGWDGAYSGHNQFLRLAVLVSFIGYGVVVSRALALRGQAERRAQKDSARLRDVFRSAPAGIGVVANRVFQDVNEYFCEMTGYLQSELVGQSIRVLYASQEEFDRVGGEKYAQVRLHGTATFETTWLRKDAAPIDVLLSLTPIDHPDWPAAVTVLALDITDRKRAERELKASLQTSADIVKFSPAGMFMYQRTADGRLLLADANPAAERLTGVCLEESRGKDFDEIWPSAAGLGIRDAWLRALEAGEPCWSQDIAYRDDHLDGIYHTNVFALPGDWLAVAFEDVTQLRQHAAERETLIADLEAKNAELERFAYAVSHDLKSPLITIRGYVGLLEEDLAKGETALAKEGLERIDVAAERMGRLLSEILELSRIGRQVNPAEVVSLNSLAAEAIESLRGSITKSGAEVHVQPGLPEVFGDRRRLGEVFQNLLENAVKYRGDQPRPRIEIGGEERGGEVLCYVRDNGLGVEPEYHERIFRLFNQLDPSCEGSGVGLALVKRIVDVHGGKVWVESEGRGRGATFWFTLKSPPRPG